MEAENSTENALPPGAGEVNHQASSRRRGVATSARSKREGQGPGDSGRERERERDTQARYGESRNRDEIPVKMHWPTSASPNSATRVS